MNITPEEYKAVQDTAPGDHHSDEYVEYLRKSPVVIETKEWLVVENIKYHTEEKPWYTAFLLCPDMTLEYTIQMLKWEFPEYRMIINPTLTQSVKRYHIHLIRIDKKYTV